MSIYDKFMKDLLTKKRKFSEETITLEAGWSAIIQKSLLEKTKDLGSFTIPVTIGELSVGKVLLHLGASINLMPLSMLKRIGELEIKPTRMTLQLADRSVKYPYGVAEDVLVKVDGLDFHVDFVIMDIKEDKEVPLILGRPFMKTAKHLRVKQHYFRVDVIEDLFMVDDIHLSRSSPLENVLRGDLEGNSMEEDKMIKTCLEELDTPRKVVSNQNRFEELGKEKRSEAPKMELKVIPSYLKYVLLEEGGQKPVIISSALSCDEEQLLIGVLRKNAWAI
ncbi:PREDICTED: uncharacterized protein LOC109340888 [Lupinus angustifolius]|uniref:uncharacterized protein LOC109340888 n=1 Tax=Lupinus angustifolius TaxID=3871 RepID=UPI00092F4497|nr:PREDICTED: uncharacterized protein LOC109340888 [Lupinus angustifolius]